MAGYQLPIKRDQHHTVDRVSGSWTVQDEASQKPIPLDAYLAEALRIWREHTPYQKPDDWIFASPATSGKNPYWGKLS